MFVCVCVCVCNGACMLCVQVAQTEAAYEKYLAAVREAEAMEETAASELQFAVESSCDEWDE